MALPPSLELKFYMFYHNKKDEDGGKSTPDTPDTGDDEEDKKDNEESSEEEQKTPNEKSGDHGFNTVDHSAVTATIMLAVTISSAFFVSRRMIKRKR